MLIANIFCATTKGEVKVLGVQYQPDQVFPEDNCIWHDRQYPGPCSATVPGANVKVFVKNTGPTAETINDVTLAGYSLKTVLPLNSSQNDAASIYYYWGTPPQDILNAGEPVWYKGDPATTIAPGGLAQAVVRLRYLPTTPTVAVGVVGVGNTVNTNITVDASAPQLASVGFSADQTKVYLHWRRTGGAAPATVWMDGTNVTASTTTVGDPAVNFGASVIQLAAPLSAMSFHVYQGVYADGKTATAGVRTWVNPYLYGTWGSKPIPADAAAGAAWIDEATAHGVNALVMNWADGLGTFLGTSSGRSYAESHGYGFVIHGSGQFYCTTPRMWFIYDEPDYTDYTIGGLPGGHNPGVMAMKMLQDGEGLRASYPLAPTTINVDGNLKPYNYWNWGQVADVFMNDAYYQPLLANAYWYDNYRIPLYQKATYIYASARTAALACEPNPMHMILYSCSLHDTGSTNVWPFAPPATKRIEVYYSLAAGAKGMSYWWYLLDPTFTGLGLGTPDALALWKEIGLLGAEIKTAQPLLVTSHPVGLPITPSANVWARALAVGADTMILLVVNDNYSNDATGCHYTPVANASVTATLPFWMRFPAGFEITASGLSNVNLQTNGNQLAVSLGTLNVTRMIVLTRDPQLRATLQQRYTQQVQPGVCSIAPELCVNFPPSITQQPGTQFVPAGGTAAFAVVAAGSSPLAYRWQKNQAYLSDGGHYAGSTTAVLTVSGVDSSDLASYRCVVTNAYGSVTSSPAVITLVANGLALGTFAALPPLPGDTTNDARAIAPDGQWAVGISGGGTNGARGFLHQVGTTNVFNVNAGGAQAALVTGVGYRMENGQREVILSGLSAGWNMDYMTTNGTGFGAKRRDVNVGTAPAAVVANGLAGTSSDVFYSTWYDVGSSANQVYVGKLSGAWPATPVWDKTAASGTTAQSHSTSATGRAVGFRNTSPKTHYVLDWTGTGTPTTWSFNGLDGTTAGEASAISTNGTVVFGQSPVSGGRPGSWGYKALLTSASPGVLQSIKELPNFPETVGTAGSASLPYGCTLDGKYAVGMSYRGIEKAVVWDTHDASATNWTVMDLTDLAQANGALGIFSRLARAYSVGTNGAGNLVIAGSGWDTNSPANTRAFVMTVASLNPAALIRPKVTMSAPYPAEFMFSFLTVPDTNVIYYLEFKTNLALSGGWTAIASIPRQRGRRQPVRPESVWPAALLSGPGSVGAGSALRVLAVDKPRQPDTTPGRESPEPSMTGKQRALAAFRGEPQDRVPVIPIVGQAAATFCGVPIREHAHDARTLARCQIECARRFGYDGVYIAADTWVNAEAVGFPHMEHPPDAPACGHGTWIESVEQIETLELPDPKRSGRWPLMVEAVRHAVELAGDELLIIGNFDQSPFDLACQLREINRFMIDLLENREFRPSPARLLRHDGQPLRPRHGRSRRPRAQHRRLGRQRQPGRPADLRRVRFPVREEGLRGGPRPLRHADYPAHLRGHKHLHQPDDRNRRDRHRD